MILEARAAREGWETPPSVRRAAVARLAQVLTDPNAGTFVHMRAAQTVLQISNFLAHSVEAEFNMDRLEAGKSTANVAVAHAAITPAHLAALAETMRGDGPKTTGD